MTESTAKARPAGTDASGASLVEPARPVRAGGSPAAQAAASAPLAQAAASAPLVQVAPPAVQPRIPAAAERETIACRRTTLSQERCGRRVRPDATPTNCLTCRMRGLGLVAGLSADELDGLDDAVHARRRVAAGGRLYRAGDELGALYPIRSGSFRTVLHTADGREQVTGFQLPGEVLGLDGIATDRHLNDAVALEPSEVWVIPYARLVELGERHPRIGFNLQKLLARELARHQGAMLVMGRMSAEERVAAFLLTRSQRWRALGQSATEFTLRMSREDLANYLGLTLETVSRMLGRLQERGLIEVRRRQVRLLNLAGLERLFTESAGR